MKKNVFSALLASLGEARELTDADLKLVSGGEDAGDGGGSGADQGGDASDAGGSCGPNGEEDCGTQTAGLRDNECGATPAGSHTNSDGTCWA